MPLLAEACCKTCDYSSGRLVECGPWHRFGICGNCGRVVLAARDPFRQLDSDYSCPACGTPVVATSKEQLLEKPCPACGGQLDWQWGHVFSCRSPVPTLGQAVHFRRLGLDGPDVVARVALLTATLVGGEARRPGGWWGEGKVTSVNPLEIEVLRFLKEDKLSRVDRLEVTFPVTREPWFAVDLEAMRAGLERQPSAFLKVEQTWRVRDSEIVSAGLASVEMWADCVSGIFHLLMQGGHEHCLLQIHDGKAWLELRDIEMKLQYSQDRSVVIRGDGTVCGEAIPGVERHTPFWVDVIRNGKRLVRWGQPRMLKRELREIDDGRIRASRDLR